MFSFQSSTPNTAFPVCISFQNLPYGFIKCTHIYKYVNVLYIFLQLLFLLAIYSQISFYASIFGLTPILFSICIAFHTMDAQ